MQKNEKKQRKQVREIGREKKNRETEDPESLCQKRQHKWRDIVMVYSWLMDEMRYEVEMKRYLFVCW